MAIFIKKANLASVAAVNRRISFYSSLTENFHLWRLFKFNQSLIKNMPKIKHGMIKSTRNRQQLLRTLTRHRRTSMFF